MFLSRLTADCRYIVISFQFSNEHFIFEFQKLFCHRWSLVAKMEDVRMCKDFDEQKVVLVKSSAAFALKNCPESQITSDKVEIPEIDAEW